MCDLISVLNKDFLHSVPSCELLGYDGVMYFIATSVQNYTFISGQDKTYVIVAH